MIGTPEYMSPEQVEGKDTDQRSDIYSLGIILYEMTTGRLPFEGETPFTIGMKHKGEIPKDPRDLNPQIPEDLSRLILRCMEKGREKRHQSTEELLSELTKTEKDILTAERIVPEMESKVGKIGGIRWKKVIIFSGAAALVILLIVVGFSLFTGRQEAIDSIAVLPLANLSEDSEQDYFADGMTDALITELSKIGALRVISRTSVMRYKGTEKLLPEIARELGVDVLVDGSVLHAEDKVRIMVQLIKATPEKHLWADDYERDLNNVIAMQKEIAQAIAQEIKITVRPEEQARLTQSHPVNPEAYQLYLKGRFFWNKRTEEGLNKGLEYFQQAIEKDPDFALGYAGLADSYLMLDVYTISTPKELYLKAREAVLKALEIDSNLAEAHTSLAWIKMLYDWDWEGAEREFKRAIELNPGYATAHRWYSRYLKNMGRFDEAMEEIKHALELDPFSIVNNIAMGNVLYYARQYDQAMESLRKTMEMDPDFSRAHFILGRVYLQKSMYEEALTEFQKEKELSRGLDFILDSWIGFTYVQMGKRSEAQDMLDDLIERKKRQGDKRTIIASFFYFALGKHDQGFEALEKDIKERAINGPWRLKISPVYDSVRSDPRFIALLKQVGLE
jgi:TolB-like protein/Tfp pilus assembly protein PilF